MGPNDKTTNLSSYLVLLDLPGNIPGEEHRTFGREENTKYRNHSENQKVLMNL